MAGNVPVQLFTNCKLTISNKVSREDHKLFKSITEDLQFKIIGVDPLIIEKDCPSQQDIHNAFDVLKEFLEVQDTNGFDNNYDPELNKKGVAEKKVKCRDTLQTSSLVTSGVDKQLTKHIGLSYNEDENTGTLLSQQPSYSDDDSTFDLIINNFEQLQLNDVKQDQEGVKYTNNQKIDSIDCQSNMDGSEEITKLAASYLFVPSLNQPLIPENKSVVSLICDSVENHQTEKKINKHATEVRELEAQSGLTCKQENSVYSSEAKLVPVEYTMAVSKLENEEMLELPHSNLEVVKGLPHKIKDEDNKETTVTESHKTESHHAVDSAKENNIDNINPGNEINMISRFKEILNEEKCEKEKYVIIHCPESTCQTLKQEEALYMCDTTSDAGELKIELQSDHQMENVTNFENRDGRQNNVKNRILESQSERGLNVEKQVLDHAAEAKFQTHYQDFTEKHEIKHSELRDKTDTNKMECPDKFVEEQTISQTHKDMTVCVKVLVQTTEKERKEAQTEGENIAMTEIHNLSGAFSDTTNVDPTINMEKRKQVDESYINENLREVSCVKDNGEENSILYFPNKFSLSQIQNYMQSLLDNKTSLLQPVIANDRDNQMTQETQVHQLGRNSQHKTQDVVHGEQSDGNFEKGIPSSDTTLKNPQNNDDKDISRIPHVSKECHQLEKEHGKSQREVHGRNNIPNEFQGEQYLNKNSADKQVQEDDQKTNQDGAKSKLLRQITPQEPTNRQTKQDNMNIFGSDESSEKIVQYSCTFKATNSQRDSETKQILESKQSSDQDGSKSDLLEQTSQEQSNENRHTRHVNSSDSNKESERKKKLALKSSHIAKNMKDREDKPTLKTKQRSNREGQKSELPKQAVSQKSANEKRDTEQESNSSESDEVEINYSLKASAFNIAKIHFAKSKFQVYFDATVDVGSAFTFQLKEHNERDMEFLKQLKRLQFDDIEFVGADLVSVKSAAKEVMAQVSGSTLNAVGNKVYITGLNDVVESAGRKLVSLIKDKDNHLTSDKTIENENTHGMSTSQRSKFNAMHSDMRQFDRTLHEQDVHSSLHEQYHNPKRDYSSVLSEGIGNRAFSNVMNNHNFISDESKLSVKICTANITELEVDCIVNAANKRLQHGGGVASAIAKAAGPNLTKECQDFVSAGKQVAVTDILVTTGGKLPAKWVMHAVGPKWDDYDDESKSQCFEALRHTVLRCLVEAGKRRFTSIALPSISSAIFRVPKEQCARCYMEAVKHFDIFNAKDKSTLREIYFVDVDNAMVKLIQECFSNCWHDLCNMEFVQRDCEFAERHQNSSRNQTEYSRKLDQKFPDHNKPSSPKGTQLPIGASAVGSTKKLEMSTPYQFGNITLYVIGRRPALNLRSDIIITIGEPFDKLSGIEDFQISSNVEKQEKMPYSKNAFKFLKVSKPGGSQTRLLCSVYPKCDNVDSINEAFKNLETAAQSFEPNSKRLILTSRILYSEPDNKKWKANKSCDTKKVGRFAQCLYDYLNITSKNVQVNFSVTVVGDYEAVLSIQKVMESRGAKKTMPGSAYRLSYPGNLTESKGSGSENDQKSSYSHGSSHSSYDSQRSRQYGDGAAYRLSYPGNLTESKGSGSENDQKSSYSHGSSHSSYDSQRSRQYGDGAAYRLSYPGNLTESKGSGSENDQKSSYSHGSSHSSYDSQRSGQYGDGEFGSPVDPGDMCDICADSKPCRPLMCCKKLMCQDCEQKMSVCPYCKHIWRPVIGTQPPGTMSVTLKHDYVEGYENVKTWKIEYYFPPGKQQACHPNPGMPYNFVFRTAYLPAIDDSIHILMLLRLSFIRKLTFTIGTSLTRNKENSITWNDIHHKTSLHGGLYGYPDPGYCGRVIQELDSKGVRLDSTMTSSENVQINHFHKSILNFKFFYDT